MWKDLRAYGLFAIALICRLPFLKQGYGKEFDAWSNAINARLISETGLYEVSRLPGHPLQELLLSSLWPFNHSYFFYNFLSALFSAVAVWAFYHILKEHKVNRAWHWALAFNFIPVFFIAGTYTIDYNFALCFILLAYWALLKQHYWLVGLFIGLATGFRISSLAFILPFALLLGWHFKALVQMALVAVLVSAAAFYLPFETYGWSFLDFHKPPFPGWPSVLYKLSLGIWGLPFLLFLGFTGFRVLRKPAQAELPPQFKGIRWPWFLALIILLQLGVFMRLPFKAEFFIPALPFIILSWSAHARESLAPWAAYISMVSLLFFGFDYKNPWRGAAPLNWHWTFKAGAQEIYCSPVQGPLSIDQSKRRVRSATVEKSISQLKKSDTALVVAGWYWPELVFKYPQHPHKIVHYASIRELEEAQQNGWRILYLPEIGAQNAIMEGHPQLEQIGQALLKP